MSRSRYYAFRTIQTIVLIWLVMTFLFFFFRMMPGNYSDIMVSAGASEEAVKAFQKQWNLNKPLHIQYLSYLENMLSFNAGTSMQYNTSVWEHVQMKIFNSFILVAPAVTLSYLIGSVYGTVLGTSRGEVLEQYGIVPLALIGSIPVFFTGIMSIIIFASTLKLVPTSGMVTPSTVSALSEAAWWRLYLTADFIHHYVLPFSVISITYALWPTMIMRTSVVEVMGQDFSYFQRVAGLPKWRRLMHTARHASLPLITLYPTTLTTAIGGLVLVEVVFNWPGIGSALVGAVLNRDFPVIQFVFLLIATFIILGNFLVDMVYGWVDPRVSIDD